MAPQKTRYKTAFLGRKLLNLKGDWVAMRETEFDSHSGDNSGRRGPPKVYIGAAHGWGLPNSPFYTEPQAEETMDRFLAWALA